MSAPGRDNEAASAPDPPPAPPGGLPSQPEEKATGAKMGKEHYTAPNPLPEMTEASSQLAKAQQAAELSSSESQLGSNTGHAASLPLLSLPIRTKGGDRPSRPRSGNESSGATGSQDPIQIPGQGFKESSEARDTRKTAPKSLDMTRLRPNSYVGQDEKPTHYLAVPISSPTPEFGERLRLSLEQRLTEMNPAGSRVVLAKVPRAVLRPEDIRSPGDQRQIKEVPEVFHTETVPEKGSLATPTMAQSAREQPKLKRDAEKAGVAHGPSENDGEDESSALSPKRVARSKNAPLRSTQLILRRKPFRLIQRLCAEPELIVRVCKYLPASAILTLYSSSYDFFAAINLWMRDFIHAWAEFNVPLARWVFDWRLPEYQYLASRAPGPGHSVLPKKVREFLEKCHEPEFPDEDANLKEYLESHGIDTSSRKGKGKEVCGAAYAPKSTKSSRSQYQRVFATLK